MIINLLTDNPQSWIIPYVKQAAEELRSLGHTVYFVHNQKDIVAGDCAFFLGCEKLVKSETLKKNKHNLVIHESALPAGKGWSPLTWQILDGKNDIPVSLFEAEAAVDNGPIYFQDTLHFAGYELNKELKEAQGRLSIELVKRFVLAYPAITGQRQAGAATFYSRRTPKDSELDVNKTIAEQFNLFRVVDNENYPAFFNHLGHKYIIKIYKFE
ncbi:MAG: formyltransferase family protein [Candidatus Magasanikbacteria bacterium]|nr:formyltransferase family protein [Candidatus Magasanikbacteria bacterium]